MKLGKDQSSGKGLRRRNVLKLRAWLPLQLWPIRLPLRSVLKILPYRRPTGESQLTISHRAAALLYRFADSVVHLELDKCARLRAQMIPELGEEAFVEVAATAAASHGFAGIAVSTGVPHSTAASGQQSSMHQREIRIDQFYSAELRDRG